MVAVLPACLAWEGSPLGQQHSRLCTTDQSPSPWLPRSNGYSAASTTIKHFWQVVRGMSQVRLAARQPNVFFMCQRCWVLHPTRCCCLRRVQEEQRSLLKFVTSCSRAPLGGFSHLNPPLTIHKVDCGASLLAAVGGKDVDRLPSASTCR